MNNQEAKFILRAYRPSGADAANPAFAEALAQARRDPTLGDWLRREQTHDQAVAAKLRAAPPPVGLRDAILAGACVSGRSERARFFPPPRWLALAASVALLLGVGLGWARWSTAAEWRRFGEFAATDTAGRGGDHRGVRPGSSPLHAWLSTATTRLSAGLPVEFAKLKADGCRTVRFAGHEVLEMCFVRGGVEYHLYAMKRPLKTRLADKTARFAASEDGRAATVVWADGKQVYALIGESATALRAVL
jgi:hypothetical protein